MLRAVAAALALLGWAGAALADWTAATADDGALFYGVARLEGSSVALICNGPSRQGLPPISVGAHEETPSGDYGIILNFGADYVDPNPDFGERANLLIWVNGQGFRLPPTWWNELNGAGWEARLPMADPMILSLLSAQDIILGPEPGPHYRISTTGLGPALRSTLTFCISETRRRGLPVPPALTALAPAAPVAPPQLASSMADMARAAIAQGCNGAFQMEPEAILTGNIDADGQPDAVLDWGAVRCLQGPSRPYCGASLCSADVYLSSLTPSKGSPEQFLALGVRLQPLTNGLQGLSIGGSLSACQSEGKGQNGCTFLWYWDGFRLTELP